MNNLPFISQVLLKFMCFWSHSKWRLGYLLPSKCISRKLSSRKIYALIINKLYTVSGLENANSLRAKGIYSSLNIVRMNKSLRKRWAVNVTRIGKLRNRFKMLHGKSKRKRSHCRPRRRWEDNIKMVYKKQYVSAWTGFNWLTIDSSDRILWTW
jgi:hypothetical protein